MENRNIIELVFEASDEITNAGYPRNPTAILTKGFEEIGELATEIGIKHYGFYKETGTDGVVGEAIDVINVMLDLIHVSEPDVTPAQIYDMMQRKLNKWKSKVIQCQQ